MKPEDLNRYRRQELRREPETYEEMKDRQAEEWKQLNDSAKAQTALGCFTVALLAAILVILGMAVAAYLTSPH